MLWCWSWCTACSCRPCLNLTPAPSRPPLFFPNSFCSSLSLSFVLSCLSFTQVVKPDATMAEIEDLISDGKNVQRTPPTPPLRSRQRYAHSHTHAFAFTQVETEISSPSKCLAKNPLRLPVMLWLISRCGREGAGERECAGERKRMRVCVCTMYMYARNALADIQVRERERERDCVCVCVCVY